MTGTSGEEFDADVLYKVVIVGDAGVGKTNMLACFTQNADAGISPDGIASTFHETQKPTIGVEFGTKTVVHPDGTRIRAQIWDTAGQERYRGITKSHFRRAAGALIVYDVSDRKSFDNALSMWLKDIRDSAYPRGGALTSIMFVGNKIDLSDVQVSDEQHKQACEDHKLLGMRTSAKTGENVRMAFETLIRSVHTYFLTLEEEEDYGKSITIGQVDQQDNLKKECCQ